ncbi:hypothetical protein PV10_03327 [Exophiala mesophila]|uniref:Histone-lysine N-methyltransferase ASH1L n=1 Tax=Exophiala mesophila TaxID=212818 RepID=A0A0D1X1Q5_EXOME|nr:uncharacterized protein PV10_03327 [Exophiala mesophila]KIV95705.1 hypothetical protein PV10_03327 [Exophiala mesophila]
MPLRQSLLNFYRLGGPAYGSKPTPETTLSNTRPPIERVDTTMSTEDDPDTIVVASPPLRQLPTPSESSLDVSIMDAQVVSMKHVPKGRARRVTKNTLMCESTDLLVEDADDQFLANRTVSGETLVNMDNASQSTLIKEGIAALDLPWTMGDMFPKGDKHFPASLHSPDRNSTFYIKDEEETEEEKAERLARAAARKAKMAENNKIWEAKKKAAEKHASRRSSRIPVLSRASELVSGIASTVLGKRKDRSQEKATQQTAEAAEPDAKKRRVSQVETLAEEPVQPKAATRRREKRWLSAGLFVGQVRSFDVRRSGSKNKRQSVEAPPPVVENKLFPMPMYAGERLLQNGRDFKLPFDIFSPLPAGQPKPDEWRKVNKNVFVGDAAQEWRVSKYIEDSTCTCTPETGCDQNCMNRYMYYECDGRNCNLKAEECGNRNFENLKERVKKGGKYNIGVEVIKTEDRGYGVRSNRSFDPNQIIVEYTGEIITQEECERRMKSMYKNNESYYLMLFDQNMIIDATRGSIARFVNHSCDPNCRMEKWTVNGKPRMALFAGHRGIVTGEELTYDYNFDPYSQKNVQECRCGADNCRGFLGPRPKEGRKQTSPEEDTKKPGKLAGVKRKIASAIEEGTTRIAKKAKIGPSKAKAKVYKSTAATNTDLKVRKIRLIKKAVSRKTSTATASTLVRRPSKLKQLVTIAKGKTGKTVSRTKGANNRVVSTSSATALLGKNKGTPKKGAAKPIQRSSSIRDKASSVKSRVVRTVKGAPSGRSRTIRPIEDMVDEE